MTQKALSPEKITELRSLRSEGLSVREVAARAGVSEGAVSNYTRGIAKPARATVVKKEAGSRAKDMLDTTVASKPDQETIDLANRLRRERLQGELDELADNRRARAKLVELEAKAKEAELAERAARAKQTSGSPESVAEIASLRDDRDRLERELAELRHNEQLAELKRGMAAQIDLLHNALVGRDKSGKTSFDLLSELAGRAENLVTLGASKIDKAVSRLSVGKDLKLALSLGLSPTELELYMSGPVVMPDIGKWKVMRLGAARQSGEPEPSEAELKNEYAGLSSLYQQRNNQYEAVAAKLERTKAMAAAAYSKGAPAREVKSTSDIVPVKCSSCGSQVEVDRADPAIARAKTGKCPGCGAIMDLTKLFPVGAVEAEAVNYE